MTDQGEKAKCTVSGPLKNHRLAVAADIRLDERGSFSHHSNLESAPLQKDPVDSPRSFQRHLGVMEEVDVSGDPGSRDQLVEGDSAGNVALAGGYSVFGY
jgi:hypothetical protein